VTPTQARESKLLEELQRDHGYMLAKMSCKDDRYTLSMCKVGKRMMIESSVVVRLVVPVKSALGEQLVKNYRTDRTHNIKDRPC